MKNIDKFFGSKIKLIALFLLTTFFSWGQITTLLDEHFSSTINPALSTDPSGWVLDWYQATADNPGANSNNYMAKLTSNYTLKHIYIKANVVSGAKYTLTFYVKRISIVDVKMNETADQLSLLDKQSITTTSTNSAYALVTCVYNATYSGEMYFQIVANTTVSGAAVLLVDDIKLIQEIICTPPTTSASATGNPVSAATKNSLTINWANGNGDRVLVVAKENATALVPPSVGTGYSANTVFGSVVANEKTGAGNFVVYNGAGNSVTVTGLTADKSYNFYVYSSESSKNCHRLITPYILTASTLALCSAPVIQASYINFPSKTKNSIDVSWTNGNGDKVLVVARLSATTSVSPTLLTGYTANSVFGSGQTTVSGNNNYVVYSGTGSMVSVTGLAESTTYAFDIYAYNSADNCYTLTTKNASGAIISNILTGSATTKSDYYNIQTLTGQTIVSCEGKFVDGGGATGNYTAGSAQTITFQAENASDGVCLTFSQWDMNTSDYLSFYDGLNAASPLIYEAGGDWDQTTNNAPKFKGPGMVCSTGDKLTIKFTHGSGKPGFLAELSCYSPPTNCKIDVSSVRSGICKGESVELIADGFIGASLLNNDFNTSTLGTDWSTLINPKFTNPCKSGLDGVYFWTNTDAPPRDLASKSYDLSQGGSISFDFRMAVQAGSGEPGGRDQCEGADLISEGVFLEYSINGGSTWVQIHYFFPPSAHVYTNGNENEWKRYVFEIPAGARTSATRFRWNQYDATDAPYDVWGLDRIKITTVTPYKIVLKNMTNNTTVGTSALNQSPYKVSVSPTVNTTYRAVLINAETGAELCFKELPIIVSDFSVATTAVSACGAADGTLTITTAAGSVGPFEYSINNAYSFQNTGNFTLLPAGSYPVVLKSPTCTATKTVSISPVSGGPTVSAITPISECVGTSIAPPVFSSPQGATVTFTWTNDNTASGLAASGTGNIVAFTGTNTTSSPIISTISVTPSLNGCLGTPTTFTITVKPKEDASFTVADYCVGSTSTIKILGYSTGAASSSFSFNPSGPSVSSVSGVNATITGGTGGPYTVTYTTSGCTNTSTQQVKVNAKVDATFDYSDFCEQQDATISAGGATNILALGGVFTISPITNGEIVDPVNGSIKKGKGGTTYTILYTPATGSCYNSTTKTFLAKNIDQITLTVPDICIGTTGTAATVTPTGGTFDFLNPPAAGITINATTGVITGGASGDAFDIFYKSLGSATSCANSKTTTVTINPLPTVITNPVVVCSPSTANLTLPAVTNTSTASLTYTYWMDALANTVIDPTIYGLSNAINTSGTYYIKGTSAAGCSKTSSVLVTINPLLKPVISCGTATSASVQFIWPAVSGATGYTATYQIGTGAVTSATPVLIGTNYTVSVSGLTSGASVSLTVLPTGSAGSTCFASFTQTCIADACPTILNPSGTQSLCLGGDPSSFSVNTSFTGTDAISFVYFNTQKTGADMYTGGTLLANVTPSGNSATYNPGVIGTAGSLSNAAGTYYIYAIANPTPAGLTCRPFQEIIITVSPNNTITLSSATTTTAQTVCINTGITNITYATTGATGATFSVLPSGVTGNWLANVVTISGSPSVTSSSPFTYTVTLTGGCGGVTTGTIAVTPNNTITLSSATPTSAQTVCINTAITNITYTTTGATGATFSGLPTGVTGNWLANVVTISGSPTVTTSSPYTYTVTLTGGCGLITSTGTITVSPINTITLSSATPTTAQTVCINTAITNITYSTTGATGATFSGLPTGVTGNWLANVVTISGSPSVTTSSPYTYTVTLTGGCDVVTTTGTITVTPNNIITLTSATATTAQTVCINTAITNITYATTGATGATFSGLPTGVIGDWLANVVTISGSPSVTTSSPYTYNITLTGGCSGLTTGTITVTPNNTITLSSATTTTAQTVCINTAITNITYATTGATGATFSGLPTGVTGNWVSNVVTISGSPTVTTSSPFTYLVTLTGGCGVVTTTGTITVSPINTITLSSATSTSAQTVCINNGITNITYATTGATGATFSGLPTGVTGNWVANVVTISGSPSVISSSPYTYTVTLTGGCGGVTTGTITVTPNNTITLSSASTTSAQTVCINTAITNITYTTTGATGATFSGLPTGVTGNWLANVVTISGSPTVTTSSPYTYTITLTGGCGVVTSSGTITVTPIKTITLSSASTTTAQTVCINTPITNITYTTTGATGATFTGLPTGVTGNWVANLVTISGSPSVTISSPYTYTVTLTGACGVAISSGVITVNPIPTITSPSTICIGNTYTLIGSGVGSGTSTWVSSSPSIISVNGTSGLITGISEGQSTITYTDNIGCKNSIIINVPNPKISGNLKLCVGNNITLTGSGTKSPTNPWISGTIQNATIDNSGIVSGVKMGPSQITYTDDNGCKTTTTVLVMPIPTTNFISDINSGCLPLNVLFTNNSLPKSDSVIWDFGDGNIIPLQQNNSEIKHTFTKAGCFDISLISYSNGCSNKSTNNQMICTLPQAEASFVVNKSEGTTVDPIIVFTNTSKNASIYGWSFGDNSGSELENVIHQFEFEKGLYLVTLVADNDQGCSDTTEQLIKIVEELVFYVPNTFTPDEDDLNKVFKPVFTSGYDPLNFTMYIFNRWGELVFETHDSEKGWNGNYGLDGEICQDGLYIWKIHYKELYKDKDKIVTGNVILMK